MNKCIYCEQTHKNNNTGCYNSGYFNTDRPDKIRIFNTWVDMTHEEFDKKYDIYANIPLKLWIEKEDMTDQEKKEVEDWKTMGGYLKTLEFKEACQIWWNENPDRHENFLNLPNFSVNIFKEITGIDVEKPEEEVEIDGKKYSKATIKQALRDYIKEKHL